VRWRVRLPVLVVGRGSNLLVADRGFPGLAVVLGAFALEIEVHGSDVVAGGAVSLPVLARKTVAAGLTGLEWAVGVPVSVGGGVRMNAGGHGSDIASTAVGVRVFDLRSGEDCAVPASALGLRFRGSDLADHQVVVSARFALAPGERVASEAELAEIVHWRREHQPGGQNAVSVFVNPVPGQLSAGEVIDGLGLRGLRIGTAEVSPKHANFIQADEGGAAADVRRWPRCGRVLEEAGSYARRDRRSATTHDDGIADREWRRYFRAAQGRQASWPRARSARAVFVGGGRATAGRSGWPTAGARDPPDGVTATDEVGVNTAAAADRSPRQCRSSTASPRRTVPPRAARCRHRGVQLASASTRKRAPPRHPRVTVAGLAARTAASATARSDDRRGSVPPTRSSPSTSGRRESRPPFDPARWNCQTVSIRGCAAAHPGPADEGSGCVGRSSAERSPPCS
jgi:UDP-N-acetylmuramate dehydrogenase